MAKAITVKGGGTIPFQQMPDAERRRAIADIRSHLDQIGKTPLGRDAPGGKNPPPRDITHALQISGNNLEIIAQYFGLDTLTGEPGSDPRAAKWKAVAMRLAQLLWPVYFCVRERPPGGRPAKRKNAEEWHAQIVEAVGVALKVQKLRGKVESVIAASETVAGYPVADGLKPKTIRNIYYANKR